jgi:KaiC/GvpD/RAD55 family RecA-like ATPase/DNA-binding CsgD family transcriptional regulator
MVDNMANIRALAEMQRRGKAPPEEPKAPLVVDTLGGFLRVEFPPREWVVEPIIPEQGLTMTHSWRGIGKTYFALGIAYAVASGGRFLKWRAPKSRRALYLDGEMAGTMMQQRLREIVMGSEAEAAEDTLRVITPDRQPFGMMPNLSTEEGRSLIEAYIDAEEIKFLVIDNISALYGAAKDNDAESWIPMQGWLRRLRFKGVAVLLVHHTGKGGAQRGTSSREDILDVSISLTRPGDYQATDGCRFEVHFEKTRGIYGDATEPFEAKLEIRDCAATWTMKSVKENTEKQIAEMADLGMKAAEIATELGCHRATVYRALKRIKGEDADTDK